jgi:gluconokinase
MTPVCKIKWLKENTPDLFSKTNKFISIKEYIWFNLFGTYEVDHSTASATGLFNIETFGWNKDSLNDKQEIRACLLKVKE